MHLIVHNCQLMNDSFHFCWMVSSLWLFTIFLAFFHTLYIFFVFFLSIFTTMFDWVQWESDKVVRTNEDTTAATTATARALFFCHVLTTAGQAFGVIYRVPFVGRWKRPLWMAKCLISQLLYRCLQMTCVLTTGQLSINQRPGELSARWCAWEFLSVKQCILARKFLFCLIV